MAPNLNAEGQGIIEVIASSESGEKFSGFLDIETVRGLGRTAFQAAETAESDSFIFGLLTDLGMDLKSVVNFLQKLRKRREGSNEE